MSPTLVCPSCHKESSLWQEVYGWQDYNSNPHERVYDQQLSGIIGCSCGFQGSKEDLIALGNDGRPLPEPISGQKDLLVDAVACQINEIASILDAKTIVVTR